MIMMLWIMVLIGQTNNYKIIIILNFIIISGGYKYKNSIFTIIKDLNFSDEEEVK